MVQDALFPLFLSHRSDQQSHRLQRYFSIVSFEINTCHAAFMINDELMGVGEAKRVGLDWQGGKNESKDLGASAMTDTLAEHKKFLRIKRNHSAVFGMLLIREVFRCGCSRDMRMVLVFVASNIDLPFYF